MDRKSREWSGGPVAAAPYPHERMGGKYPPHEVGAHGPFVKEAILANVIRDSGLDPAVKVPTSVDVIWTDSRMLLAFSIYFVPTIPGAAALVTGFYNTDIWLAACENTSDGLVEVEDLLGTKTAPVPITSSQGLRGCLYSPTEEVEAMRATLNLGPTDNLYIEGKWLARARWQAQQPMSEIEWRDAISKCQLISRPPVTTNYGPPG